MNGNARLWIVVARETEFPGGYEERVSAASAEKAQAHGAAIFGTKPENVTVFPVPTNPVESATAS